MIYSRQKNKSDIEYVFIVIVEENSGFNMERHL